MIVVAFILVLVLARPRYLAGLLGVVVCHDGATCKGPTPDIAARLGFHRLAVWRTQLVVHLRESARAPMNSNSNATRIR